jgi:hypothetical protein
VLQLYRLERDQQSAHDSALTRIALGHAAQTHRIHNSHSKRGRSIHNAKPKSTFKRQQRYNTQSQAEENLVKSGMRGKLICYNCNEPGHIAPNCPHQKRKSNNPQQVNAANGNNGEIACAVMARIMEEDDNILPTQALPLHRFLSPLFMPSKFYVIIRDF